VITYKRIQKVEAITFDLDDTLYDNMPYIYAAEASLLTYIETHYNVAAKTTPEQWKHIKLAILKAQPELKNDLGKFRTSVLTEVFTQAGMPSIEVPNAVKRCFEHFYFKRSDFSVSNEVISLLRKLAQKVPIAAITNGNVNCEAIGIAPYFSHIVHADYERPMKPNRPIFDYAASLLQVPAANILHVGDDLENDVKGAIEAGYQAAWYADNRHMSIVSEPATLLPHVQLSSLHELHHFVK